MQRTPGACSAVQVTHNKVRGVCHREGGGGGGVGMSASGQQHACLHNATPWTPQLPAARRSAMQAHTSCSVAVVLEQCLVIYIGSSSQYKTTSACDACSTALQVGRYIVGAGVAGFFWGWGGCGQWMWATGSAMQHTPGACSAVQGELIVHAAPVLRQHPRCCQYWTGSGSYAAMHASGAGCC
jgi:hypothetical protein